jgi:hypothetical protein
MKSEKQDLGTRVAAHPLLAEVRPRHIKLLAVFGAQYLQ